MSTTTKFYNFEHAAVEGAVVNRVCMGDSKCAYVNEMETLVRA